VYGPDYVDEFAAQVDRYGEVTWFLQDANYNVVALLNEDGEVLEQYTWEPYGEPAAIDRVDPDHPNNRVGHQGLFFERLEMDPQASLSAHGIDRSLADELLEPTRIYVRPVRDMLCDYSVKRVVHGMAHITGGGLPGNIARILPPGCGVELEPDRWARPRIFDVIQKLGEVEEEEMYRTFNMGVGMVLAVSSYYADSVMRKVERAGQPARRIGQVVEGEGDVHIVSDS
jgi:hypothetical protein